MKPTIATIVFIVVFVIVFFTNLVAFIAFMVEYFDFLALPREIDDPILGKVAGTLYALYQYIKQVVTNPYGVIALIGIDLVLLSSMIRARREAW